MADSANFGNAFNSSSNYSEALPVSNRNLAGYKEYDDLLALLKKLHHSGKTEYCHQANKQLRLLNTYLSDDQKIKLMKCHNLQRETVGRRYRSVKELSMAATNDVLRWGRRHTRKTSSGRRKTSGGAGRTSNRRTRSKNRH